MKKEADSEPEKFSVFFLTATVVTVQHFSYDDDPALSLELSQVVAKIRSKILKCGWNTA